MPALNHHINAANAASVFRHTCRPRPRPHDAIYSAAARIGHVGISRGEHQEHQADFLALSSEAFADGALVRAAPGRRAQPDDIAGMEEVFELRQSLQEDVNSTASRAVPETHSSRPRRRPPARTGPRRQRQKLEYAMRIDAVAGCRAGCPARRFRPCGSLVAFAPAVRLRLRPARSGDWPVATVRRSRTIFAERSGFRTAAQSFSDARPSSISSSAYSRLKR